MHPLAHDLDHVLAHTGAIWEAIRGSNIFITGGTGFVGTWLLESFIWANERLHLDARAYVLTRETARAALHPSIYFVSGNVTNFLFPDHEFPFVIHASTEAQFEPTSDQPVSMYDSDIAGTRRVLQLARTHGTRRLLFTSSGAAYGRQPSDLPHTPETYGGAPSTVDASAAYGHAKRAGEWLCTMHARQYGFDALIARLFAFVGPHLPLDRNFAIGNFIRDVLAGGPVRIEGDGTPYRSYLYAADLSIWLWTILLRGQSARVYNVGSPEAVTIADLARAVTNATVPGTPIEIARNPVPGASPSRYVPSTHRAEDELNLRVRIPLHEAIRRTFEWHRP